jgi:phage terminase small subunit
MVIRPRTGSVWQGLSLLSLCLALAHCSHDIHEKRADTIKVHVESFYNHLKHDRVAAAVRENEAIEHLSSQLGDNISRRVNQPGTNQVDREWTDLRTAKETAAQNWLALGQYLSIKKQYAQARATYQRVVDTYTGPTERTYRDQAVRAIRDLDLLNPTPPAQ